MVIKVAHYVVLDANILIRDFWLRSQEFQFLRAHQFLGHRPVVPHVAFLEAKNHLRRRAEELLSNKQARGDSSSGNRTRLLRTFNYRRAPAKNGWNIEKLLIRWEKHLLSTLQQAKGSVLPSPDATMDEIVERSISRKKPFSAGDRGFRDTMVWLSTLALISENSRVSFVTANTQDFFEAGSANAHPEVLAEADARLGPRWKMLFHRSLEEFIFTLDGDRRSSTDNLRRALVSNSLINFDLWNWIEDNVCKLLEDYELDQVKWAGIGYHAEAPELIELEELITLDVPRVAHLEGNVYKIYCDATLAGVFQCDVGAVEADMVVHPRQIMWTRESEMWTRVGFRAAGTIALRLDLDMDLKKVVSAYVTALEHWKDYDEVVERLDEHAEEIDSDLV